MTASQMKTKIDSFGRRGLRPQRLRRGRSVSDHSEFPFDCLDSVSGDAGAVGRRLKPRPLRGLGECADIVLDPGWGAEKEHPGGVGFDSEGVRSPARCERNEPDAAALSARAYPGGRIAVIVDQVGFDDPSGHLAFENVEGLILRMGMQRRRSASWKDSFPKCEPPAGVVARQLHAGEGAEKPQRITARSDNPPAYGLALAHDYEGSAEPIPIQTSPSSPATIWRRTSGGQ